MPKYQTEKMKRDGETGDCRNPAAKEELGERRVRFWEGCHGELEMENEERDWDTAEINEDEDDKRRTMRRENGIFGRFGFRERR